MGQIISAGSLLIKEHLPEKVRGSFDATKMIDKKGVARLMEDIIKHGGDQAHSSIQNLSNLFFGKATEHGYTTPLSDYENDSAERKALIEEFESMVRKISADKKLSDKDKSMKLGELSSEYSKKIWKQNQDYMVAKGSTAGLMALTGARGNTMQLGQGTTTPLMAQDIKGNPIPIPIKRSFAEGLRPAEHIAMSYGGRSSTVKTQLSTSKPGALFKAITPNVFHEVITMVDCGTHNGVTVPVSDKKALMFRVLAGTSNPIDEARYKDLVSSGVKQVKVRSTLTCEAKDGICQHCYGIDSYGSWPKIGQNVGVIAAQSISEVLTQAMLSTKHKGGVAGRQRDAYEEAENLLNLPDNFKNAATVAHVNGRVADIKTDSLNNKLVHINGTEHFVPSREDVVVKVGDDLRPGDRISTGTINPKQVVALKGLGAGRKYFSEALRDAYSLANDELDPRHFDIVSKNIMRHVVVKHPGDTGFIPGQKVEYSKLVPELQKTEREVHVGPQALGKKLSRMVLELTPGTTLDRNHVDYLHQHGVESVHVSESGLDIEPIVRGVSTSKLMDPNFVSRLALNRIEESLIEAASKGEKAKIHSTDPITSYVLGREFGEGGSGAY